MTSTLDNDIVCFQGTRAGSGAALGACPQASAQTPGVGSGATEVASLPGTHLADLHILTCGAGAVLAATSQLLTEVTGSRSFLAEFVALSGTTMASPSPLAPLTCPSHFGVHWLTWAHVLRRETPCREVTAAPSWAGERRQKAWRHQREPDRDPRAQPLSCPFVMQGTWMLDVKEQCRRD